MKKSRILFFCDAASGKTLPKAERAARKALPSDCTKRETHSAFVLHFPSPYRHRSSTIRPEDGCMQRPESEKNSSGDSFYKQMVFTRLQS